MFRSTLLPKILLKVQYSSITQAGKKRLHRDKIILTNSTAKHFKEGFKDNIGKKNSINSEKIPSVITDAL